METKRILIDLSFDYGMNHMGFESSLTRQEIAIDNQKLQKLTIREFCMLTREEVLSADGMTVDKLSASSVCWTSIPSGWACLPGNWTRIWTAIIRNVPKRRSFMTCATVCVNPSRLREPSRLSTRRDSEPSWTGNYMAILWMGQGSSDLDGCITRPCARLT